MRTDSNWNSSSAKTLKDDTSLDVIWCVEIDASEPGESDTTYYYATRAITINSNAYSPDLAPNGITLGWNQLKPDGGLGSSGTATVQLVNVENEAAILDTYYLGNDELRIYVVLSDGSPVAADLVPVFTGVIETYTYNQGIWTLQAKPVASKDLKEIPTLRINPKDHPNAPESTMGKVLPVVYGNISGQGNQHKTLMPAVDQIYNLYSFDPHASQPATVYQKYNQADKLAQLNWTLTYNSDGYLEVDDVKRSLSLDVLVPMGTNDVTDWYELKQSGWASLNNGDNLDLYLEALPRLGVVTAATFRIYSNSTNYDYDLKQDGTSVTSATGQNGGTAEIDILNLATWDNAWGIFTVEIDGHVDGKYITAIEFNIEFDDTTALGDNSGLILYGVADGRDVSSNLIDGTSTFSNDENPVGVIDNILRAKDMAALPVARRDITSFAAAYSAAESGGDRPMSTDLSLVEVVDLSRFLDEFAFFFTLHLYPGYDGKWKCTTRLKETDPVAFLDKSKIAVKGANATTGEVQNWEHDISINHRSASDVITDVFLRYGYAPEVDNYGQSEVLTGRWVVSGNGNTTSSTKILTDATATFQTDRVKGDNAHKSVIEGVARNIKSVDSETQISFNLDPGDQTGVDYYLGPDLDPTLVAARLRYGVDNSLGQQKTTITKVGGFTTRFTNSSSTAENFTEYVRDFMSEAWMIVELGTFYNALDLEVSDVVLLSHDLLPDSKDKTQVGTLNGAHGDTGNLTLNGGHTAAAGQWILVDDEVMEISSISTNTITPSARGGAGTTAASHADATAVYYLPVKWEIQGVKYEPFKGQIRLKLQELPAYL